MLVAKARGSRGRRVRGRAVKCMVVCVLFCALYYVCVNMYERRLQIKKMLFLILSESLNENALLENVQTKYALRM